MAYNGLVRFCQRRQQIMLLRPFDGEQSRAAALRLVPALCCHARPVLLLNSAFEGAVFCEELRAPRSVHRTWEQHVCQDEVWQAIFTERVLASDFAIVDVSIFSTDILWEIET